MSYDLHFTIRTEVELISFVLSGGDEGSAGTTQTSYKRWVFSGDSQSKGSSGSYSGSVIAAFGRNVTNKYFQVEDLINYKNKHAAKEPTNHYPYTGDIGLGNTNMQYEVGTNNTRGHYVCYVHSTLKQAGIISALPSAPNIYTATTAAAVRKFQSQKGLVFSDGIVDSETKSALAYVWCVARQNGQLEQARGRIAADYGTRTNFLQSVYKYMDLALQADHIGTTALGKIARISYTNSSLSPTSIQGEFYLALPDEYKRKKDRKRKH